MLRAVSMLALLTKMPTLIMIHPALK
jgi:hypothetical protein